MKGLRSYGKYGAVGLELVLSILIGTWLGAWLDRRFETTWIQYVGFLVGCYSGFRALFRAAKTMQKDIEREEALERGEDPWADEKKKDDDEEGA
jgi:F0F1-type ATP synthase assembly protein I